MRKFICWNLAGIWKGEATESRKSVLPLYCILFWKWELLMLLLVIKVAVRFKRARSLPERQDDSRVNDVFLKLIIGWIKKRLAQMRSIIKNSNNCLNVITKLLRIWRFQRSHIWLFIKIVTQGALHRERPQFKGESAVSKTVFFLRS